jgi:hypothetical protein
MFMGSTIAVLTLLCPLIIVLERSNYAYSASTKQEVNLIHSKNGNKALKP